MSNHPAKPGSIPSRFGYFFFRYRNGLFPIIFLALFMAVRPALFLGQAKLDLLVTGIGAACALAGGLVRILTIGLVYIKRGGRDNRVSADDLVTDGIYAHVRNPMYLGNLLIAAGICLMYGSPWLYAGVFPLFLLIYISIVAEEERYLSTRFGPEFDAYRRSTPRFWPKLNGILATIGNYRFRWKRVLKKEYGTTFSLLAVVYLLAVWKYGHLHGLFPVHMQRPVVIVPLLLLLAGYLGVVVLKKTRRI
ncbi:MAG TPA: isoprenylcysteine carboxylmethyltransferase family protein [Gammaproteobacteria bacterium]|nr:isoprenylcysteine carboxylmethyltransferase family protein [Gammaproteobacteria bacterium]